MTASSQGFKCTCCGGTAEQVLYVKAGCEIRRCNDCGVGRALAVSFDPESYYSEDYFCGGHADGYANYADTAAVLKREFAATLDAMRAVGPKLGRLLEVGCAYGYFLELARPYYEVHGIELAGAAVTDCHRRGLRGVRQGQATTELLDEIGPLDVVVMLDVIEHLPDPVGTLRMLAERLRPGGAVLITTGDFASLAARLSGAHWRLMTPPQHLWFFTPTSMRRVADAIGLQAVEISHPWKIVPVSLIAYQLRRVFRLPQRTADSGGARIGLPVNLFDAMRVILRKPG